jgi:hypothetical protein
MSADPSARRDSSEGLAPINGAAGAVGVPQPTSLRAARSGLAMAAAAGVLWAGLYVGMTGVIALLFGAWWGLVIILAVIGVAIAVLSAIARAVTGRQGWGAGISVTLVALVALGVALAEFRTIPMIWVEPGLELVYPVIAMASALAFGLFLGPRWIRIVGAIAAVAVAVGSVVLLQPEPAAIDRTAPMSEEEQFAEFRDLTKKALVSDAPGSTVARVDVPGGPVALVLTEDGGAVEIYRDVRASGAGIGTVDACAYLSYQYLNVGSEDSTENYSDWCVADDAGWARVDGRGYLRVLDGTIVIVRSAYDGYVQLAGGQRAATPAEVAEALATLRPITDDELRVAFESQQPDGSADP